MDGEISVIQTIGCKGMLLTQGDDLRGVAAEVGPTGYGEELEALFLAPVLGGESCGWAIGSN